MNIIITEPLQKMCEDSTTCNCPSISGDKACSLVELANSFVTETNPVKFIMSDTDWQAFRLYVALASLRGEVK